MKKKINYWRLALQLSVFAWLIFIFTKQYWSDGYKPDFEAYCPVGGLQALSSYLYQGTLACSMTSMQIVMGIVTLLTIILFGKLFCSYICPLGTIVEYFGKIGEKFKIRITVTGLVDQGLRSLKYILLFVTVYFSVTSSELFCKNFDPFFAVASGFHPDVTVWMAVISIILLFAGSVFIRMFWCKYICPFGALSNIFKLAAIFIGTIALYSILVLIGLSIPWFYLLAVLCIIGYIIEITKKESKYAPFININRNSSSCVDCGICSTKCPQDIDVANLKVVKHIDCNLCGECIASCPVEGTLTYSKKIKSLWFPAAIVVVLIIIGMVIGSQFELPTINEKWGSEQELANAKVYEHSHLQNIHCYGSSKAFMRKIRNIKGLLGVSTYVKTNSVKILYNEDKIKADEIRQIMFTPSRYKIKNPTKDIDSLKIITLGVENMFAKMDVIYLKLLLMQHEEFYGIETEYGCPVKVKLFVDPNMNFTEDQLKEIIETDELVYSAHKNVKKVPLKFEIITMDKQTGSIGRRNFLDNMFKPFYQSSKKRLKLNDGKPLSYYDLIIKGLEKPIITRTLPYLFSHLSCLKGVVSLETCMREDEKVVLRVKFIAEKNTLDEVKTALFSDTWNINYKDGTVKPMPARLALKVKK